MKMNWNLIKLIVLGALLVTLYSFSNKKNNLRKINGIKVDFIDETGLFITDSTVNKLLIQNYENVTGIDKETLVLERMEARLLENPMIKKAEVFLTIDGILGAKIEQRKPLARVVGTNDFYLDDEGKIMPLSGVHSARVPLVMGNAGTNYKILFPLLKKINEDGYMKLNVIGLIMKPDETVLMQLRKKDYLVQFGKPVDIDLKFQKLKAFVKIKEQDTSMVKYSMVNLQYGDQVVATKKMKYGE